MSKMHCDICGQQPVTALCAEHEDERRDLEDQRRAEYKDAIDALRAENAELREENAALKKTNLWFLKQLASITILGPDKAGFEAWRIACLAIGDETEGDEEDGDAG